MSENDRNLKSILDLIDSQPGADSYDKELITRAFNRCVEAHSDQKRASGEPFYMHPIAVAKIVLTLGMDSESVAAALLHDVVEDTVSTYEDIKSEFGQNVADLVDGVTKLGKIPLESKENEQAENIRKMFIAMSRDIRVIIIKLADRLHNMRTIDAMPLQKQRDKSRETLEIFAPIAHRLGIRAVKEELEDLSIMHLDPVAYHEIEKSLTVKRSHSDKFLAQIQKRIKQRVEEVVPGIIIEGRVKSIHGIYRKMYMQGKSLDEIYDVYAVRIITDTVANCYNILGVVHDMARPIPGRFKDYIATPKPNLYQSLHTTVIGREGIPFEVQIRTMEMHRTAEYGIAAHWKYKDGVTRSDARFEERLAWIRQILDNQREADDAEDLVQTIKTDLAPEDVFAVTPKGDVIDLPVGSTVIDFAFAIHSAVGTKMVGAKVDGRIVPITHEVKTGELIEIITSNQANHGPSRDWLNIVKTNQAKAKIRAWFKKERRPENIATGRTEIEREFARNNIRLSDEDMEKFLDDIATKQRCNSIEDFYAAIGYGGILLSKIMPRIKDSYARFAKTEKPIEISNTANTVKISKSSDGVVVEGIDNCLIKLARCCTPIPGDDIIGFITRGHGVSIHKRDCSNVPRDISASAEPERWISAYWEAGRTERFDSTVSILSINRDGMVADLSILLANLHVSVHAISAKETKDGNCSIIVTIGVESREHLDNVIARIRKLNGVFSVERS